MPCNSGPGGLARGVGIAWLARLVIGILAAVLWGQGIDTNLSADVEAVARNMLEAEARLRALAYTGLLIFGLELFVSVGLFLLLKPAGLLLGANAVTLAFMMSNLVALVSTGLYLVIKGVRVTS